ncbi:MAG: FAD:protein FMN transferase [Clostridia bacterium]|nr:FAD:protein FMN transferase [Clostridia bacterium]
MKKRITGVLLVVCTLLCSVLSSCQTQAEKNKYSEHSFDYFDTVATITGYADSKQEFDEVAQEVFSMLSEYHKLYDIYHRYEGMENLCTINELVDGEHHAVTVDRRIIDMLLYAKQMYESTDGMMNVAMGSVLSLWHDYRTVGLDNPEQASLPPSEKLKEASLHTDITKMIIDEENCTVLLTDPLMKLDVGAVAKGYATERIALYLEEKGITGYVLNIGGNVRTIGSKADGQPWVVGIENGLGGDYLAYLQLNGQSVVTSGSYQRYYTVDGKQYHHIIHPETQMPAEDFLSVSVVCNDSALGDSLSTALFCMSLEEGVQIVENMPEVEVMWVNKNGEQTVSSGWNNYIKK